jgi:predicted outer membrane protein
MVVNQRNIVRRFLQAPAAVALAAAVAACAIGCADRAEPRHPQRRASTPARLSDGEIARVLLTVYEETVAQAKAAGPRLSHPDVKGFAETLRDAHEKGWDELMLVLDASAIEPEECQVVLELRQASLEIEGMVDDAPPSHVDAEFIQAESALLSYMVSLLEARLIDDAENANLRANLKIWRNRLRAQLEDARRLGQMLSDRSRMASFE